MCGIAGVVSKYNSLPEGSSEITRNMVASLHHRGPDSEGFFDDQNCALGMRRLAIVDLKGGDQPIYNESKEILVFQNGEIYNYSDLRIDLEAKGHSFRTTCDTEVLVHLYEEYDTQMFSYINGMFSFCLYDTLKKLIIIARDRFGEKPLYYSHDAESITFASEINALLENPNIQRILDHESLYYYLRTSLIPSPKTLFKNVQSLPAGHYLKITGQSVEEKKYFSIDYVTNRDIKTLNDAKDFIRPKLESAINRQLMSNVPVASFLSGGIDSSTLVALRQKSQNQIVKTFNIRFEDQSYDESIIAKRVADYCGTEHHEIIVPNQKFEEDIFWKIIEHVGQPFRDSSAIPTFRVAEAISQHAKVAISGDGGDEMFGGYSLFSWYKRILSIKKYPDFVRSFTQATVETLGNANIPPVVKWRQLSRALHASSHDATDLPIALNEMFVSEQINDLLASEHVDKQFLELPILKRYPDHYNSWSNLRKIMFYRTQFTLPDNMLVKVDRMSMANSLETRAPFLDKEVAEAASQLPDEFLMKGSIGKVVLREMMKNELPAEVFNHPKQGFNLPLHNYQNDEYKKLGKRLLFDENPLPELFDNDQLKQVYLVGTNVKKNNWKMSRFRSTHQLWMIMQLLGWAERYEVKMAV